MTDWSKCLTSTDVAEALKDEPEGLQMVAYDQEKNAYMVVDLIEMGAQFCVYLEKVEKDPK